ncbi:MAG: YncE family protein [Bacteroidales bacterium]|nr:YncE family protein [Bacteroidales bacterium]
MKKSIIKSAVLTMCLVIGCGACRSESEDIIDHQEEKVNPEIQEPLDTLGIKGFFLLNEGNMGSNKCTLDYYDALTGTYLRNIYAEMNPGVVQELGDVGNDIQVYDNKLWAVINCSHFVEVMQQSTARHIAQISIPNCRYICFDGQYAYVSSYAGPVQIDPNARLGYVAKINVNTLQQVDTCVVGYQPEEMVVTGNKLYVANSGGYRVPNYDRTVSVIDLTTFRVMKTIDVAINLHRLELDRHGFIWVSSRGDYYEVPSKTYVIDTRIDEVCDSLELANSEMALAGDSLYVYGTAWSYLNNSWHTSYAVVDTQKREVISNQLITDGTDDRIAMPYGIAVNPDNGDFYITDAGNYVSPGMLYCFTAQGRKKWEVRTGDIPAHFAFTRKSLQYDSNR